MRRYARSRSAMGSLPASRTPRPCAIVGVTKSGSAIGARSTNQTPSEKARATSAAMWRAGQCQQSDIVPLQDFADHRYLPLAPDQWCEWDRKSIDLIVELISSHWARALNRR